MKHTLYSSLHKATALLLALVLTLSLAVTSVGATDLSAMSADSDDPLLGTKFEYEDGATIIPLVTEDGGQDYTFAFDVEGMTLDELKAAIDENKIVVSIDRDEDKPYVNEDLFPNLFDGGTLDAWLTEGGEEQFSELELTAKENEDGKVGLEVSFHANNYFCKSGWGYDPDYGWYPIASTDPDYSVPHTDGGYYIDLCGYFDLNVTLVEDEGETLLDPYPVKVVPYKTFNTMWEIYTELDNIVEVGTDNGLYVEKFSMGQSTAGRDMPYLIIADSEESVDEWLELTELAENDPETVLEMIENGELDDIHVPVLYSNVHSNETAAADGVLAFAQMLVSEETITYDMLTGFTAEGEAELADEMGPVGEEYSVAIPDLVADKATYLGYLTVDNSGSGKIDLEKYYEIETNEINVKEDLLSDVFFVLVPEENVDGRTYLTRHSTNGYDLNRDNSFQTTSETANMQWLIGTYNPMSFAEFHGRINGFQCEPCDPPHEPNFEYDLLSNHLVTGGEALGIGAVANNSGYNSYVMPQRDYLSYTGEMTEDGAYETYWYDPWDDMSTSYTPQFAMLHGTVSYTVELPAYSDDTVEAVQYGILAQAAYVAEEKLGYLADQVTIFKRGVNNENSNETVNPWLTDQYDVEGAEGDIFRPVYDGEGQNGNFYPECYIIPLDRDNQSNLQAAADMMEWLTHNHVKVNLTTDEFTYDGVTYPAGTMIVSMYQAKRSVANGALYDGTFINGWTVLYSEGITSFNETRGFDMAVVAEPAAYEEIAAVCGDAMDNDDAAEYLADFTSSFEGVKYKDVIISNVSEDSTAAVNELLKLGKTVGMVTEGDYTGDFICSYKDYLTVASDYVLTATGVYGAKLTAQVIGGSPVVYLTGEPGVDNEGFAYTTQVGSAADWNYDRVAMELMEFDVTSDLDEADAIVGASSLTDEEMAAVQSGMAYIGYNCAGSWWWTSPIEGVELTTLSGAMDCLMPVIYPNETLVNASYISDGDDILYGYGLGYFSELPEGAQALVITDCTKTPTEGFIPLTNERQQETYDAFMLGGVQGFSYQEDGMNIVLFANTLTNKAHQRDEYGFISNFLFSSMLTDEAYEGKTASSGTSKPAIKPVTPTEPSEPTTPAEPTEPVNPTEPTTPTEPETNNASGFADVPDDAYYSEAVAWAKKNNVTKGVNEKEFGADEACTRAQVITFLWRAAGCPTADGSEVKFDDVNADSYYAEAVAWALANSITGGVDDSSFAPDMDCTRAQIVTFLYRYAQAMGMDTTQGGMQLREYDDYDSISEYALAAMQWAVNAGILQGYANSLTPNADCTRAQSVTLLFRAMAE